MEEVDGETASKTGTEIKSVLRRPTKLSCSHVTHDYMRTTKKTYACFVPC